MSIDQERAERAVERMIHTARPLGEAKAKAVLAEAKLRRVKSLAMKASGENAVSAQEREAYASDAYDEALTDLFEATREFETLKAEREAAQATVEFWRSVNSNQRAAERGYGSAR